MKTPYAILIGLALIAAAIFFRQPAIAPAQAGLIGGVDGFKCEAGLNRCAVLHGDKMTWVVDGEKSKLNDAQTDCISNWR